MKLTCSTLAEVLRREWRWWLPFALLSPLLASVLLSGWPQGLRPDLSYPLTYASDGYSHSWLVKRLIEGGIWNNDHSGFPFGSAFYDYPGADGGNLLVIKFFSLFSQQFQTVLNLYLLSGFAATFIAAYAVLRACGVRLAPALAAAVLFNFLPFHLERLHHVFLTWYLVAPLFFYAAFRLADGALFGAGLRASVLTGCGLLLLGCFGVYYAVFGLIVMGCGTVLAMRRQPLLAMRHGALAAALVVAGIAINVAPNLAYQARHGANPEIAQRNPHEGELYALRLTQLLLPHAEHRVAAMAGVARAYNDSAPLVNENTSASLGVVGAVAFLLMLGVVFAALAGRPITRPLRVAALMVLVLFLFGTMGGLGSVVSYTLMSSLRGWNRISVFLSFGALLGLCWLLQARWPQGRLRLAGAALAACVAAAGVLDQSAAACDTCNADRRARFQQDRDFVARIEASLPAGGAIYQLPYMAFPEVPPLHDMTAYEHMAGYLHSRQLHWSYGGSKGREGDLFYRALAQEPLAQQLAVIERLGFSGLTINRRGYADHGAAAVAELERLTGAPAALARADGQVVFFRLGGGAPAADLLRLDARQLMARADFVADHLGRRVPGTLAEGIDFAAPQLTDIVSDMRGLSGREAFGRWSDARSVVIGFRQPLPQRFTLVLKADSFGPNAGKDLLVRAGGSEYRLRLQAGLTEYRLPMALRAPPARQLELVVPQPASPQSLGMGGDARTLGIALHRLRIEAQAP